ncbi:MAG: hypothetical protein EPO55_20345 [Reyranella sp.]|uniref:hypothetical protein n=1 Tax=Reyranella sp. TaxID=1929291 RepID=UPI001215C9C2|nr:hypothetical protein [Reyranella sp.]TAJ36878.1 MAG: hypothetical protein EPO55_20345 [Reyranella sp.]
MAKLPLNRFMAESAGAALLDHLHKEGVLLAKLFAIPRFRDYTKEEMLAARDYFQPEARQFLETHGFFGDDASATPSQSQGGTAPKHMSYEEAKVLAVEMMRGTDLNTISQERRLIAQALINSNSERECFLAIRKGFYTLSKGSRFLIVKEAFEEESAVSGLIRQLISELPEEDQSAILGTGQLPSL